MRQAAVVIDVEMREHDTFDIDGPDAECAQLRADLLLPVDPKRHLPSSVRMEGGGAFEQLRPLPVLHDNHAFRVRRPARTSAPTPSIRDPRISRAGVAARALDPGP